MVSSSDNLKADKQGGSLDGEEISGYRWHGSKQLRRGYTTGTCAAAACRAAALALLGQCPECVPVKLPDGGVLNLKVEGFELLDGCARAWVIKDGGDDPDVTHGARIEAVVRFLSEEKIAVKGGEGVGVVTKAGLAVPPGQPAINPVPMTMIKENLAAVLPPGRGAEVAISVPDGKRLAKRTMNPQLGIIGGISILGTTGIVEPMSEEAFKQALIPQLQIARSAGLETLLLTPGRRGVRLANELLELPIEAVIMTSNFIGFIMEECQRFGFGEVILWGHAGKLAKVAAGVFQTHNRVADGRAEVIAALAGALGAGPSLIKQLLEVPTVEGMVEILKGADLEMLWGHLAERASRRAVRYARGDLKVGTVMFSYDRTLLGYDQTAVDLLKARGWLTAECGLAAKIKGESPG
jgi:cobalt-precorrin-5B (C1)-methyltransferase